MYIPQHFVEADRNEAISFMKRFSFASIITAKNNRPVASHLPFVVKEQGKEIILLSHFARANAQWTDLADNQEALVIFNEPHAYISPSNYESLQNVPTWNYIAVHAYGRAQMVSDTADVMAMLEAMIDAFEPAYRAQWGGLSDDFKHKMSKGIAAFTIKVERLEAKRKLSQNKKDSERKRIVETLSKSDQALEQQIAEYMKKDLNAKTQ